MADEKALSEMDELSLLRLAGKKFNMAAEVSNRLKASAAKAGGQLFLLGVMIAETEADIQGLTADGVAIMEELEARSKKKLVLAT